MVGVGLDVDVSRGKSSLHLDRSWKRPSLARLIGARIVPNSCIHFRMNSGFMICFSVPWSIF